MNAPAASLQLQADLACSMASRLSGAAHHVALDGNGQNGLAQLVLALLNLIHELLERQAVRRMEGGSLSEAQIEALGAALMAQAQTISELCAQLGIEEGDLAIDLGPLGRLSGDSM